MKKISITVLIAILIGLLASTVMFAQDTDEEDMMDTGLLTVQSEYTFDETVTTAQAILEEEGFGIPLVLDHSANAESVDLELLPTTLILFGNPMVGTSLMQESPSMAIDLPQKLLVWEDEAGNVYITYNDPLYLANRHGVVEQDEKLMAIADTLQSLAERIASTEPMMNDADADE